MEWRNTLTVGVNTSPAQRMFARQTRTTIPTSSQLLKQESHDDEETHDRLVGKKQQAKRFYDKQAKELPEIRVGEEIRLCWIKKTVSNARKDGKKANVWLKKAHTHIWLRRRALARF